MEKNPNLGPALRSGTPADAAAVARLYVDAWRDAYRGLLPAPMLDGLDAAEHERTWRRELAATDWPRSGVLLAHGEPDGALWGFVAIGPVEPGVGEVRALYLDAARRGHGVGGLLLDEAVRALASAGHRSALLWVLAANARARGFYEASGWRTDGTVHRSDRNGYPTSDVVYRREL